MLLAVAIALPLIALVVALGYRHRTSLRRRVLVNLIDGKALDGVLWSRGVRLLTLKDVTLLEPGVDPARVDGEVIVERSRVDFVQALGR